MIFSFAIPFLLGQNQLVTGIVVNAALFVSSTFPGYSFLPIVILPSLAVLGRGLIFGPQTSFLVYFFPFVWLGNLVLIFIFRGVQGRWGNWWGVSIASLSKYLLLFSLANLFFHFNLVPRLFLQTMGFNQLATALLGGIVSLWIIKRLK